MYLIVGYIFVFIVQDVSLNITPKKQMFNCSASKKTFWLMSSSLLFCYLKKTNSLSVSIQV